MVGKTLVFFMILVIIPGPWNLSSRSSYTFLENVFLEGGPQRLKIGTQKKTYFTSIVERVDTEIMLAAPKRRSGPVAQIPLVVQKRGGSL